MTSQYEDHRHLQLPPELILLWRGYTMKEYQSLALAPDNMNDSLPLTACPGTRPG